MRNFKIILQYEGTRYQGWQRQESTGNTIQGKLEAILAKMTGEEFVQVNGSGRTDAGVHALGQAASFKLETDKTPKEIMDYMNRYLPDDIKVIEICEMPERFHSRLNAKKKTYVYRIWNSPRPCVFERRYVYELSEKLDRAAMEQAAALLIGKHDFKAFTSTKKSKKSTVRTIERITIVQKGEELVFTYKGDGFLYHMVRILTGTLVEVGLHERDAHSVRSLLEEGTREQSGQLVPAKGLCLVSVEY